MQIVIDYTQNVDVPEENRPLALGKVYIGEVDEDAKTNQVQAYIQQENGTPFPINQPIRLGAGGTVSYNGSPARILCDSQLYSLRIDTKDDEQAYYISDNTKKAENIFFDASQIGGTSKNLNDAFVEFSQGVQSDLDSLSSDINNVQNNVNSLDNQLQALLPAGSMIMFASSNPPAGWLVCNGVSLSTTAYPALFNAIGYRFGGSGSNFNLPDTRGEFVRGYDAGRGVDSGRPFGSYQTDAYKSHSHQGQCGTGNSPFFPLGSAKSGFGGGTPDDTWRLYDTSSSGSNETRPRNIALSYIIKT